MYVVSRSPPPGPFDAHGPAMAVAASALAVAAFASLAACARGAAPPVPCAPCPPDPREAGACERFSVGVAARSAAVASNKARSRVRATSSQTTMTVDKRRVYSFQKKFFRMGGLLSVRGGYNVRMVARFMNRSDPALRAKFLHIVLRACLRRTTDEDSRVFVTALESLGWRFSSEGVPVQSPSAVRGALPALAKKFDVDLFSHTTGTLATSGRSPSGTIALVTRFGS